MKSLKTSLLLSLFTCALFSANYDWKTDPVFKALADENQRTAQQLKMDGFPASYFVEHMAKTVDYNYVDAMSGAILDDTSYWYRQASVKIRVGSPAFDNTNFDGAGAFVLDIPFDASYDGIRRPVWLYTDAAYKYALERLTQKISYIKRKNITEFMDDFSVQQPSVYIGDFTSLPFDKNKWRKDLKELSALMADNDFVHKADASFEQKFTGYHYVNNEGGVYRKSQNIYELEMSIKAQAQDGFAITPSITVNYARISDVESFDKLKSKALELLKYVKQAVNAPKGEMYIGPAIFDGVASARLFSKYLAKELVSTRTKLTEKEKDENAGEFYDKLGLRVMAPIFDVLDNPLLKEYKGTALVGHYEVDDEGTPAQAIEVVKQGKLVSFVAGRTPVKGITKSNGHGRGFSDYAVGAPSNMIIKARKTIKKSALIKKLLNRCKELGLEYGIIIKSFPFSNATPFEAYKIYVKDKKMELVRGMQLDNVSPAILREIEFAGDDEFVYNHFIEGLPVSITAPSVMIRDIEIKPTQKKPEKFPFVEHPHRRGKK